MRSDPPPSLPVAAGHRQAATAAAAPPLDPPGVRSGIPRVASQHPQGVLARAHHAELRHVGLADHHRTCVEDALDHGGVALGHPVRVHDGPHGRPHARGHLRVLDGQGQAVQGAEAVAPHHRVLRRPGPASSPGRGSPGGRSRSAGRGGLSARRTSPPAPRERPVSPRSDRAAPSPGRMPAVRPPLLYLHVCFRDRSSDDGPAE